MQQYHNLDNEGDKMANLSIDIKKNEIAIDLTFNKNTYSENWRWRESDKQWITQNRMEEQFAEKMPPRQATAMSHRWSQIPMEAIYKMGNIIRDLEPMNPELHNMESTNYKISICGIGVTQQRDTIQKNVLLHKGMSAEEIWTKNENGWGTSNRLEDQCNLEAWEKTKVCDLESLPVENMRQLVSSLTNIEWCNQYHMYLQSEAEL